MRLFVALTAACLLAAGTAGAHDHEKHEKQAVAQKLAEAIETHEAGHDEAAEAHGEAEAHAEAHDEAHGGHHGHDISQINWVRWYWSEGYTKEEGAPFIGMVLNFIVLLLILYWAGRKAVPPFLKNRRDRLMENIDEASRMKKEAEESHKHYSEKLSKMEKEEEEIRDELLKAAVREKERLLADAGARAEKMRAEAKRLVQQEEAEAEKRLRDETSRRAVDVARGILEKKIGPGEQRKLVDQYLTQLGG